MKNLLFLISIIAVILSGCGESAEEKANRETQKKVITLLEEVRRSAQYAIDHYNPPMDVATGDEAELAEAAIKKMSLFNKMDATMDRDIRGDMMNSGLFLQANDLAKEAMHELVEVAYQSAKSLQSSLDVRMAEFEEVGWSFQNAMNSQEIKEGLARYSLAVRDATALTLISNGSMQWEAVARLGLYGKLMEHMTAREREQVINREQELVLKKSVETADKAKKFLEKTFERGAWLSSLPNALGNRCPS